MIRYRDWAPTGCDPAGAYLPDQQDWWVVPVMRTRDSGPLDESNFQAALKMLGGERKSVQVHRFNHWGPGWFEIILVHSRFEAKVREIEESLENYPLLDEEDLSRREWEAYEEAWENWGYSEFLKALKDEYEDELLLLDEVSKGDMQEFYEQLHPNITYEMDGDGVRLFIGQAVEACTWRDVKRLLYNQQPHPEDTTPSLFPEIS